MCSFFLLYTIAIQLTAGSLADDPALKILIVNPVVDTFIADADMLPIAPAVDVDTKEHTTIGADAIDGENVTETSLYEFAETLVDAMLPLCCSLVVIILTTSWIVALDTLTINLPFALFMPNRNKLP